MRVFGQNGAGPNGGGDALHGHAAMHDFTPSWCDDPYHPYEETKDWIWYKPADE